jgi:hypothetical protein
MRLYGFTKHLLIQMSFHTLNYLTKNSKPRRTCCFLMIRGISLLPRQRERAVEGEDAIADGVQLGFVIDHL